MRKKLETEAMSSGLLRIWDNLNTPNEIMAFKNAYERIFSLYISKFKGVKTALFFDRDFMKNYDFSDYRKSVKIILSQANKNLIFLDRPNDPISCLVLGIEKIYSSIELKQVC